MENKLFDWENWDQADTFCFLFFPVTLKVQVGEHPPGTVFDSAALSYDRGILELFTDGRPDDPETFKLTLQVS